MKKLTHIILAIPEFFWVTFIFFATFLISCNGDKVTETKLKLAEQKIQEFERFLYNIPEHEKRKLIPGLLSQADRLKAHTLLEPYKEMFPAHYRIFASPIQRGTGFNKPTLL